MSRVAADKHEASVAATDEQVSGELHGVEHASLEAARHGELRDVE
jgi:hypothetical protein